MHLVGILQAELLRHGLTIWYEMKLAMKKQFEPRDYKQRAYLQLNQLKQGSVKCGRVHKAIPKFGDPCLVSSGHMKL